MAQHIKLIEKGQRKVFKSVGRIVRHAILHVNSYLRKDWSKDCIYRKNVMRLPKEYADYTKSDYAFQIGPFTLENVEKCNEWLAKDTPLEVHCNIKGEVTAIFWVV